MAHVQKKSYRSRRTGKISITWQARYTGPDGKERTKRFARKVDAETWLDINGADIARGSWIDPKSGQILLRTFAEGWLANRQDLRPTTQAKYRILLDRHVLPQLGDTRMSQLSSSQVRIWYARLSERHQSTAAGAYRLLATICRTAVDDEVIVRSPCRVKGGSTERSPERPVATVEEIEKAVAVCPKKIQLAVLLAAWCQLRRGEILGLQRRDIDLLHGTLAIRRTWSVPANGSPVEGPPKTTAGVRTIAIPPNVMPVLKRHLQQVTAPKNTAWLFPGEDGHPISPRTIDRAWSQARLTMGRVDVRFHDLRHSGLTWAATTGASTAELMRRAGHATPAASLRYQHATEERDRSLANALGKLSAGAKVIPLGRTKGGRSSEKPKRQSG